MSCCHERKGRSYDEKGWFTHETYKLSRVLECSYVLTQACLLSQPHFAGFAQESDMQYNSQTTRNSAATARASASFIKGSGIQKEELLENTSLPDI